MRILRVRHQNNVFYASLHDGQQVVCLNKELGYSQPIPLQELVVLPPVQPTKVVCVGTNYRAHAEEMGKTLPETPLLFMKPPSAVIGSGQPILLPPNVGRVDYEGELAIVIGKVCHHVDEADAPGCVFGYACANDISARELQKKDGQWTRAKGFDTFCPVGPWIETEVEDPSNLPIRTLINGEVRQNSSTSDMIFPPFYLVSFISRIMTLMPGDTILTGTPSGVGPLKDGDEARVEIDGVGLLINQVFDAAREGEDGSAAS